MPNYSWTFKDPVIDTTHPSSSGYWRKIFRRITQPFRGFSGRDVFTLFRTPSDAARLDRGWIIANHKLVSFHAAFLTSLLSIPLHVASKFAVMREMFLSVEVVISSLIWYAAWHIEYRHPRDGALFDRGQNQQSETGTRSFR